MRLDEVITSKPQKKEKPRSPRIVKKKGGLLDVWEGASRFTESGQTAGGGVVTLSVHRGKRSTSK